MTIDDIDLLKHAVIEASAGTGKTHTIEQLVLRLLLQTDIPLERILIVTFTEKATGELKERIRRTLTDAANDPATDRAKLNLALTQFDQAPIFTIHGFCQRLLHDHAVEQSGDFRPTLVNDAELLPAILRDVQLRLWRTHFGQPLRNILERSGFNRKTAGEWDHWIAEIAKRYQPRAGHRLLPSLAPDWWKQEDADISGCLQVFTVDHVRDELQKHKQQRGLQSYDDMIANVEASLDGERNPDAARLLERLRDRFRYGIVDEFQDTDPLQWRIFRRIFLKGGSSRLFVVGDPKQAIFGFRSADLPTYIDAARQMVAGFGATGFPLKTNWRSDPNLIEALNCVFGKGGWFPEETQIEYVPVEAPKEDRRQTQIIRDQTDRAALTVVNVTHCTKPSDAGKTFGRFVAHEIRRLLCECAQPALRFTRKREERGLEASDICVLVAKRKEAKPIIALLNALGIPTNFYKPTGFWQTDEVRELETLLVCLSRPDEPASFRKALLTRFFRVRPQEMARADELPMSHPARTLFQRWLDHADARRWSALFQSMLEDTGLLVEGLATSNAELQLTGFKQAMSNLERVGHGENRDLLGIIEYIRGKRQGDDDRDAEPAPIDTHGSRVQFMTIHASKGLEFPVVFLAGGFTKSSNPPKVAEYRDAERHKVFDFCPNKVSNNLAWEATKDEHRRLFYVAMTRAIFKLYVPLVDVSKNMHVSGPTAHVLEPAIQKSCPEKLGPKIAQVIGVLQPAAPRKSTLADARETRREPASYTGTLFPSLSADIDKRRLVVRSFSSMARHHVAPVGEGTTYGDRGPVVIDEAPAATESDDPLRGPVFGDIVHNVLEAIDFAEVGRANQAADLLYVGSPARGMIEKEVHANVADLSGRGYDDLEQAARQQVAQLVWNALRTPLTEANGPLCDVAASDQIRELAFHLRDDPAHPAIAGLSHEEGFVTGYMDLVFRCKGRYFLVDYKTNLLPGYTLDHLKRCMTESDYHHQYELYLQALDRWLKRLPGKPPAFGGVYYLFVRGMNGIDDAHGVFFSESGSPTNRSRA